MVPCTPPVCWKRSANCALRTFIGQEDAKVRQFSGAPFAPPADAMTRNPSWSEPTLCTLNGTPLEVSPVVLFFNVTVNEPAARISCPETCVLLPPAPMLKRAILAALGRAGGNYTEAAKLLGVHPNYLHRLVRNFDLREEAQKATDR
jgi:hypothetical protein